MKKNILIVESKNDKFFLEALIQHLNYDEIEARAILPDDYIKPLKICIDDYKDLKASDKTQLQKVLNALALTEVKNDIDQHQKEKITLGQASQLAQMNQLQFQHLLASREIPINYAIEDLETDLKTASQ